jgi:cytochrome P450
LVLDDLAGKRTTTIHRLHEQYGTTVRIGPSEISVSNAAAVKEVYGQQTDYLKSDFYDSVAKANVGIFSMRNKAEHSRRRRLLSHAFSQQNLLNTEPLIREQVKRLVTRVDESVGRAVDMFLLFRLAAFDIIGKQSMALVDRTDSLKGNFSWDSLLVVWIHKPCLLFLSIWMPRSC